MNAVFAIMGSDVTVAPAPWWLAEAQGDWRAVDVAVEGAGFGLCRPTTWDIRRVGASRARKRVEVPVFGNYLFVQAGEGDLPTLAGLVIGGRAAFCKIHNTAPVPRRDIAKLRREWAPLDAAAPLPPIAPGSRVRLRRGTAMEGAEGVVSWSSLRAVRVELEFFGAIRHVDVARMCLEVIG